MAEVAPRPRYPYNFFYYGTAINKDTTKQWGRGFQYEESFYKYACGLVFENAKRFLNDATVIDGSGSKDFRRELERYLKKRMNDPKQHYIKKVKVQGSSRNNLLQLVDMVVGASTGAWGRRVTPQFTGKSSLTGKSTFRFGRNENPCPSLSARARYGDNSGRGRFHIQS